MKLPVSSSIGIGWMASVSQVNLLDGRGCGVWIE